MKSVIGVKLPERGKDWHDTVTISPEKAREGTEIEYPYMKWGKSKNLMVKIPPKVRDGKLIRLKAMGSPGKAGGEPGDL